MTRRDDFVWDSEASYNATLQVFAQSEAATNPELAEDTRRRVRLYLNDPDVAADVGLTADDLRQFAAGFKTLSRSKLARLARRIGVRP